MCSSQTTGHNKIQGTCPYGCSGRWTGLQEKCDTCENNILQITILLTILQNKYMSNLVRTV